MRWLPARAYDNGIYAVFTNPIGLDDGEVRNGNAMVLDPFGEVIAECDKLGDDVTVALCTPEKIDQSSGRRYIRARRVDLYDAEKHQLFATVDATMAPPLGEVRSRPNRRITLQLLCCCGGRRSPAADGLRFEL